jgi:hypothetical protein
MMDDGELIGILRRVGTEGAPPFDHDIEELLVRGRHARRRRRAFIVSASSLVVAGVAALAFSILPTMTGRQQLLYSPSALRAAYSTDRVDSNQQVLEKAFGADFAINPEGDVTVRPGSPAADGLPAGLRLWTQLLVITPSPQTGELAQFCEPMIEKGTDFSTCTQRVLTGGQVVYEQRIGSIPDVSPAGDSVRVIYVQPTGQLVIVDLVAEENERTSTSERRAAAQAWLESMTSRMVIAATNPSVSDAVGKQGAKTLVPSPGARITQKPNGSIRSPDTAYSP